MNPKHHGRLSALILATALLTATAWAQPPKEPPKPKPAPEQPAPTATSSAEAEAAAAALAAAIAAQQQGQQQGQGQTARGGRGGDGGAGGTAAADSYSEGSQASGVGDVDVGGDVSRYRSTAIALSVPGATAAPAVPGECLRHTSGWSAGMGVAARSGATKYDKAQCERVHCLAIADRYAHAGLFQAMADQLATCGGVEGVKVVAPPADSSTKGEGPPTVGSSLGQPAGVTPADLAAMEQRLTERMDRQAFAGLGK